MNVRFWHKADAQPSRSTCVSNKGGRCGGAPSIGLAYTPVRGTTYSYLDAICKNALSILARKNFFRKKIGKCLLSIQSGHSEKPPI